VDATLRDNPGTKVLAFVHAETSTGVLSDAKALTDAQKRGFDLYVNKGRCVSCHVIEQTQALFTDNRFHNVGVGINDIQNDVPALAGEFLKAKATLAEGLGVPESRLRAKAHFIEHHLAHIGSSFFVSPFERAAVLSIDGFGDMVSAMWGVGEGHRLRISGEVAFPHSLGVFYTAVARAGGENMLIGGAATLVVGLATLACAIWFDMRDPMRSSRASDHAFWLHMAAAPQIIFGIRGLILGYGFVPASTVDATVMLLVLIAFGIISLALNRRALIVSGLLTFGGTLWVLVDGLGGGNGLNTIMLVALIVGGSIVLLGGGWRTARRFVLKAFPAQGTLGRIFPPEPA